MKKNFSVLVIATIALFSFYLVKSEASSVTYEWGVNKVTSRSASSFVYSSNAGEALYTNIPPTLTTEKHSTQNQPLQMIQQTDTQLQILCIPLTIMLLK